MAIRPIDLPSILLRRIEHCHPSPAYFSIGETDEWPTGALPSLVACGVLAEGHRAEAITCPGCELQCHKRVVVRQAGAESIAIIMCDEEPRHGRVSVSMRSLTRFETGLRALCLFISSALEIGPPVVSRNGAAYALGTVKGRNGLRRILVAIDDGRLRVRVGDQIEPLDRALRWSGSGLALDTKVIRLLADRKQHSSASGRPYAPDRTAQRARANKTRQRNVAFYLEAKRRHADGEKWSDIAKDIAGRKRGPKTSTVRRIIAAERKREREKFRSRNPKRK
jgi:hypothetical protein